MPDFDELIDAILPEVADWDTTLANLALDYVMRQMQLGAQAAEQAYDLDFGFDVYNPEVTTWLNSYTGLMAHRVNDTMRESIREALVTGLEAGEAGRKIEQRILESLGAQRNDAGKLVADDKLKYRAEMITRTETARAQSAGQDYMLREAGATGKTWVAAADCCEFCAELDGTSIGADESFFKQGDRFELLPVEGDERTLTMNLNYDDVDYPPLHPNCRCVARYEL